MLTTKPPSSKPGLVESEPPKEVVPAPPTRGAAPTSTLRASAVPFAPPEAITGAAVQSKDKFMSLSTHLAPPLWRLTQAPSLPLLWTAQLMRPVSPTWQGWKRVREVPRCLGGDEAVDLAGQEQEIQAGAPERRRTKAATMGSQCRPPPNPEQKCCLPPHQRPTRWQARGRLAPINHRPSRTAGGRALLRDPAQWGRGPGAAPWPPQKE